MIEYAVTRPGKIERRDMTEVYNIINDLEKTDWDDSSLSFSTELVSKT